MNKRSFKLVSAGINAGVVGILLAGLYNPIFVSSVYTAADFALAVSLGLMLSVLKRPPWNVVLAAALGGLLIGILGYS